MCGIAGIVTKDGRAPNEAALKSMIGAMPHRGPDGNGIYQKDTVGFVHTRLAIIDLKTGDQPFQHPNGTALVANGEVYNYLELKEGS